MFSEYLKLKIQKFFIYKAGTQFVGKNVFEYFINKIFRLSWLFI